MSVILRPRRSSPSQHRLVDATLTARSFAALVTVGAVILALVLATTIPARADSKDDLAKALIAALVIGAIAQELTDSPDDLKPAHKPRLTSICAISIQGDGQAMTFYSGNCLKVEGYRHSLPRNCSSKATIFGERDRVYSARCLRKAGFKVSGY